MSKTIKVSGETYGELEKLLTPRETFDGVVRRILYVYKQMKEISDDLGPGHYLKSEKSPASQASSLHPTVHKVD